MGVSTELEADTTPGMARKRSTTSWYTRGRCALGMPDCIMAARMPPQVVAVLDWELATLGDPLADLGMTLFYWREAGDIKPALTPAPAGH